jgi:hypothetical protein
MSQMSAVNRKNMTATIKWPQGKDFAFTIFDDPDLDTIENVSAIYSFLDELGFRTTKAVWPIQGSERPKIGGATCENKQYLEWVLSLQQHGFEIALHNVTYHTSTREQTAHGLDTFRRLFGHDPHSMSNHSGCHESIYWGRERLSGRKQTIYDLLHLQLNGKRMQFQGHLTMSPLFWGDLCRDRIKYVRNFVLGDINTLNACPEMPYHDPSRPYVNYWFAGSEGPSVDSFNAMTREANQDRLVSEGGACIMYTHLASGFLERGSINKRFKVLMRRLSKMNGWFVPVHTLLDHILNAKGNHNITPLERSELETRWLYHKLFHTGGRS